MGEPKYRLILNVLITPRLKAQRVGVCGWRAAVLLIVLIHFITKGTPDANLTLLYDTLTQQSLDEPFTEYGLVAEKIELAEDRSFVIFHINPKANLMTAKRLPLRMWSLPLIFCFTKERRSTQPYMPR